MEYRKLGRTDLSVSTLCLGSMTWGTQNTEDEGHAQIDMSLDHGINFIDTAEMYPTTPLSKETQGDTESIIGTWLAKTGRREDVIVATKISGIGAGNVRERNGAAISPATIRTAVENSLKRLQTDYIDLYQFHWPNRGSYHFRKYWTNFATKLSGEKVRDDLTSCLETMDDLIKEGKVRHFGTSNETCWGATLLVELAEKENLPRMVSIQNEYSLLCRIYDLDLAEFSMAEDVGLLSYSPLAAGLLSGKYQGDKTPAGSRRTFTGDLGGRITEHAFPAVDAYMQLAQKHGLDVCQMALAWCITRPFMTSVIFGATSEQQLTIALKSSELKLSDEVLKDIEILRRKFPMPI